MSDLVSSEKFGKVALLVGGMNSEREVSLMSGKEILASMQRQGIDAHWVDVKEGWVDSIIGQGFDRAFIGLHGEGVEDGCLQGFLETIGLPYTGCGVLSSALCMNKASSKSVFKQCGLPVVPFKVVEHLAMKEEVISEFGLPLCIKPDNEGSSMGVTKVKTADQFEEAFLEAKKYDDYVLAEPWIEGRELSIVVINDETYGIIEIIPPGEFYDYQAKYFDKSTKYPSPKDLSEETELRLQKVALAAYRAARCEGMVRVDFMLDNNLTPLLMELNTLPGMTPKSLAPKSVFEHGIDFDTLINMILSLTL